MTNARGTNGAPGVGTLSFTLDEHGVTPIMIQSHRDGLRINKDGKPIEDDREAADRTQEIVGRLLSHQLPLLIRFGIANPG